MLLELPLTSIESNPYNSRIKYQATNIERLAQSLRANGQLSVVKVRPSRHDEGRYELVFGHRRVMAARTLGWKTIRAEVVNASEEEMIVQSLVENFEHEDLSDYEKALIFERMSKEFGKTYEQIGKMLGISKQHVSNYMNMLRLFNPDVLSSNPELLDAIQRMSEHHARVLSRIDDLKTKADLACMIARDRLSVKELTNMVGRLRSWFANEDRVIEGTVSEADKDDIWGNLSKNTPQGTQQEYDIEKITKIIVNEFRLAHKGDFNSYKEMHLFGEGFSIYSAFPPFGRIEGKDALYKERQWFYEIAPKLLWRITDLKIDILGEAALATLSVSYSGKYLGNSLKMELRGTVVLTRKETKWRIMHEHWSRQDIEHTRVSSRSSPHPVHSSTIVVPRTERR